MTLDNNLLKKIENFKRHVLKSIPLPSTNTPSTDNTNGSTGSSLEYARSDHQHPKSTLYAESVHTHNDILSDLMDDINNTTVVVDSPNPIGQDGDTILLRGRMYGDDVSGKSIDYYIGNTLIGSSVTNGNGVSFLDYECDGLGVRNVTAKNGSIISEPYNVWDTIYAFDGKTATNKLYANLEKISITPSSEGTHIQAKGNYSIDFMLTDDNTVQNPNTHSLDGTKDIIFEFDFKTNNQMQINLRDNSGSRVNGYVPSFTNDYRHWKWIYNATAHTCDVYEDNAQGVPTKRGTIDLSDKNMTTMGMQWIDWQSTSGDTLDCWIKDFKVYYG